MRLRSITSTERPDEFGGPIHPEMVEATIAAAQIAVETIRATNTLVGYVRFVAFDQATFEIYTELLRS